MVVTRRQSAGPMPAVASRTNSSAGTSRSGKGKGVDKTSPLKDSGAGPSHIPPNGSPSRQPPVGPQVLDDIKFDDDIPPPAKSTPSKPTSPKPKSKSKKKATKAKKHHENKGISIFDIISRLFLVWFTIYTLSVCPEDVHHRSPVCRALTEYRRLFLEPYVYPPIRATLDHPSVAPYIQRAQPYYNHVVQVSTPWVRRAKREWRGRVVPQLQWLQIRARPYIRQAERQYDATMGPYVHQVSTTMTRYRLKAEPYVLSAALKTHQAWTMAKPYTIPVWQGVKHIPGFVAVYVGKPLGAARRQWVDPQVIKIWEAVVEQGKADTTKANTTVQATTTQSASTVKSVPPSSSVSTSLSSTYTVPLKDAPEPSSDRASISPPPVPEQTDEAASAASSIVVESAAAESSTLVVTSTVPVYSVPEPSLKVDSLAVPPIPEPTDEAAISASSVIHESVSPSSSSTDVPAFIPSDASARSSSSAQPSLPLDDEDLEDLEAFLSELNEPEAPEPPPPPPPPRPETEEERIERERLRDIEAAEKRADIEGRHDQWEIDIQKLGKARRKLVRSTLAALREEAVQEAHASGSGVRVHIDGLLQEAEKALKALKAYGRKLTAEDKPESVKVQAWKEVVDKVDKKFGDRVDVAAESVKEWWDAQTNKEIQMVEAIGKEVMELANKAQDDVGMDYAWLYGVTYQDWQRYHNLRDSASEFKHIYFGMQNGTLPNAPPDPVADVMEAIQEEVDDMILGFEASLSRIKSSVISSFASSEEEDSKPISNKPDSDSESEPEVSILPIDPTDARQKVRGVPPIILSRGAEEVESAVSRAEEAKTKAAHVEL